MPRETSYHAIHAVRGPPRWSESETCLGPAGGAIRLYHPDLMEFSVISIGALSANPIWDEREAVRTGHATTTLVRTKALGDNSTDAIILVDPGLPEPALVARLHERAGITPEAITHVFLTTFHPETRRAITAFPDALWLVSPRERESAGVPLAQSLVVSPRRNRPPRPRARSLMTIRR